jgi:hypothetical protein
MSEPQEKAAMTSVLYLPSRQLDLRIAFMANVEGGGDLGLLPSGERYFEAFRASNDGETELRYDVAKLFRDLNQLVTAEQYLANPLEPLPPSTPKQASPPENQPNFVAPKLNKDSPENRDLLLVWIGLVAVVLIFIIVLLFKKHR